MYLVNGAGRTLHNMKHGIVCALRAKLHRRIVRSPGVLLGSITELSKRFGSSFKKPGMYEGCADLSGGFVSFTCVEYFVCH